MKAVLKTKILQELGVIQNEIDTYLSNPWKPAMEDVRATNRILFLAQIQKRLFYFRHNIETDYKEPLQPSPPREIPAKKQRPQKE